jgi:hypothetical protein
MPTRLNVRIVDAGLPPEVVGCRSLRELRHGEERRHPCVVAIWRERGSGLRRFGNLLCGVASQRRSTAAVRGSPSAQTASAEWTIVVDQLRGGDVST